MMAPPVDDICGPLGAAHSSVVVLDADGNLLAAHVVAAPPVGRIAQCRGPLVACFPPIPLRVAVQRLAERWVCNEL